MFVITLKALLAHPIFHPTHIPNGLTPCTHAFVCCNFVKLLHIQAHCALFSGTTNTLSLTEVVIPLPSPGRLEAALLASDYRTEDVFYEITHLRTWYWQILRGWQPENLTDLWLPTQHKHSFLTQLDLSKHLYARRWFGTRVLLVPTLGPLLLSVWISDWRPTWTVMHQNLVTWSKRVGATHRLHRLKTCTTFRHA